MLKYLLLLTLMLLVATPAYAALTSDTIGAGGETIEGEQSAIRRLVSASTAQRAGHSNVANTIITAPDTQRTLFASILTKFKEAEIEHRLTMAYGLHYGPDNTPTKPDFTNEHWAERFYFHLNRYEQRLTELRVLVGQAQALYPVSTTGGSGYDNLRRAKDIHLTSALAQVNLINTGLTFTSPHRALRTTCTKRVPNATGTFDVISTECTIPTVVGPHGDELQMGWSITRGIHYWQQDAIGPFIALYASGRATGQITRDYYVNVNLAMNAYNQAMALLVDVIPTGVSNDGNDRFCRAVRINRLLTVSATNAYKNAAAVASLVLPLEYRAVFGKMADSWFHGVDNGAWQGLIFVQNARCELPLSDGK